MGQRGALRGELSQGLNESRCEPNGSKEGVRPGSVPGSSDNVPSGHTLAPPSTPCCLHLVRTLDPPHPHFSQDAPWLHPCRIDARPVGCIAALALHTEQRELQCTPLHPCRVCTQAEHGALRGRGGGGCRGGRAQRSLVRWPHALGWNQGAVPLGLNPAVVWLSPGWVGRKGGSHGCIHKVNTVHSGAGGGVGDGTRDGSASRGGSRDLWAQQSPAQPGVSCNVVPTHVCTQAEDRTHSGARGEGGDGEDPRLGALREGV